MFYICWTHRLLGFENNMDPKITIEGNDVYIYYMHRSIGNLEFLVLNINGIINMSQYQQLQYDGLITHLIIITRLVIVESISH